MVIAFTREVSSSIGRCELTHLERQPIDLGKARDQHRDYERFLWDAGCTVRRLKEEAEMPDAVFVEDIAVVLDEVAIITRPGTRSRRRERLSITQALEPFRRLARIRAPGTLDGGDVLRIGRTLYVGQSIRSNEEGRRQLRAVVSGYGYSVRRVAVVDCLHLKSAVTVVAEDNLLFNPGWVDANAFQGVQAIAVDPEEPAAANALLVAGRVVLPAQHPRTIERLSRSGFDVRPVDVSELTKAEGGVTCCSLVFDEKVAI
ncbi:MAG: dimethylargininase [Acidobacteriota bacterium]|nr:dimethylargininase [Acidobacteriota bacterium]